MKAFGPLRRAAPILAACLAVASCGGRTVRLGDSVPPPYRFGDPTRVPELASSARSDNPTLTSDLLEIYFTSTRTDDTGGDIWFASRASANLSFGTPSPVSELNTDGFETSSAISADGLTLWFGSDRPGGSGETDIWVSQRADRASAWPEPTNLAALNTSADDIPRPPGQHGLVMPLASTKAAPKNPSEGNYQSYLAARPAPDRAFAAPVAIPALAFADRSTVDGYLTDDGLALFYSSSPTAAGRDQSSAAPTTSDLFVAFRSDTDEPFTVVQPLTDLNTSYDERDPWLSPDGATLYFTSDRDGALNIYSVAVEPR